MGVRRSKKNKGSGCLIFLILFIGLPLLSVNTCSNKVTSRALSRAESKLEKIQKTKEAAAAVETTAETIEKTTEESLESEDPIQTNTVEPVQAVDPSVAAMTNIMDKSALEAISQRSSAHVREAEYYQAQKSVKNRRGVYSMEGPLVDNARIFSSPQYVDLCSFLLSLDELYGIQIGVLTVKDMDGESIEEFSMKHAEEWKLGQKGVDNGVLFVLSLSDRSVRIETGYGAEAALTDAYCSRIINKIMIPSFKSGNYAEGLTEGVKNAAGILLSDESLISPTLSQTTVTQTDEPPTWAIILAVVIVLFILIVLGGPTPWLGHSNGHHSGGSFGGGGFSGGGFSGGGGGFGGGGASGHW